MTDASPASINLKLKNRHAEEPANITPMTNVRSNSLEVRRNDSFLVSIQMAIKIVDIPIIRLMGLHQNHKVVGRRVDSIRNMQNLSLQE